MSWPEGHTVRRRPIQVAPLGRTRKRPLKICASMSYGVITEESAADGDYAEERWEFEHHPFASIRDLVEDDDVRWKTWAEWSDSDAGPDAWIVGEGEQDYQTGESTTHDLFVKHCDGSPITWGEAWYLTKRLGLFGKVKPKSVFDAAHAYWRVHGNQKRIP